MQKFRTQSHGSAAARSSQSMPAAIGRNAAVASTRWVCKCGFKNRNDNKVCGGIGTMGCKAAKPADWESEVLVQFAGAGVLPTRMHNGVLEVLLPVEVRHEYKLGRHGRALNILGGKRDRASEKPEAVAARELEEETARLMSPDVVADMLSDLVPLYVPAGRYFLFVVPPVSHRNLDDVAPRYNSMVTRPIGSEAEFLTWVSWSEL